MKRRERILNLADKLKVHEMLKPLYSSLDSQNLRGSMLSEQLCEIMPIIEKAAPLVSSLIKNDKVCMVIGLLGMLVNCNPSDTDKLVDKLKKDDDLYAKLASLEESHGNWLINQS